MAEGVAPRPSEARNPSLIEAFGLVLREVRLAMDVSQEELAHRAGISRNHLQLLETGRRQATLSVIVALEEAAGYEGGALVNLAASKVRTKARIGAPRR